MYQERPTSFYYWATSHMLASGRLVSATMETGETIAAAMFIDATYEGDLMAAANVSYRVDREPKTAYQATLAAIACPTQILNNRGSNRLINLRESGMSQNYQTIIVVTDGTQNSTAAEQTGCELALQHGANVFIVDTLRSF